MKTIQMDLFYEKPTGYYKYWYRIYSYMYGANRVLYRYIPQP